MYIKFHKLAYILDNMKYSFSLLVCFTLFYNQSTIAQSKIFNDLEQKVQKNNHLQKFDTSINLINTFILENESSYYDNYLAYLLKADTFKSVFNYKETFVNLNMALAQGLKTTKKDEVEAVILAKKAFAYFDIQDYKKSIEIMWLLKLANYKYITEKDMAYLIMQEGYINYLNKNYIDAEIKFDKAIVILNKVSPENLPIIYGKKVELYKSTGNHEKSMLAFNLGYDSAKKSKLLKYQIYMYEQLREQQMIDNDWKAAFKSFQIIKNLETKYNAEEANSKLKVLEKDIEIKSKIFELKKENTIRNFLVVLLIVLLILLSISFRLHKSNVKSKKIIEYEFDKINNELKILTNQLDDKGFVNLDLSKYNLSPKQLEIIELIRKGKSNKEIGSVMFITANTVKYHLKTIYEVLNIENRSDFFKIIS